jgi:hypothetical protein
LAMKNFGQLFNLPLRAAFTSYSPLRLPPPRLYHAVGLVTNITLGDGVVDYSQDRIAQGSLDVKIGHG